MILGGEQRWRVLLHEGEGEVTVNCLGELDEVESAAIIINCNEIYGSTNMVKQARLVEEARRIDPIRLERVIALDLPRLNGLSTYLKSTLPRIDLPVVPLSAQREAAPTGQVGQSRADVVLRVAFSTREKAVEFVRCVGDMFLTRGVISRRPSLKALVIPTAFVGDHLLDVLREGSGES